MMRSFLAIIVEAFDDVERYDSKPAYHLSYDDGEREGDVFSNPSVNTFKKIVGRINEARGLIYADGTVMIWTNIDMYHDDVWKQVSMGNDFVTVMFYTDEIGVKDGADREAEPVPFADERWLSIIRSNRLLVRAYGPDIKVVSENWG